MAFLRIACLFLVAWLAALPPPASAAERPVDVRPEQLLPGEFVWLPEAAPEGPLLLVVSLLEQRAYLYRNGVRIAVTTVSSGKPGFDTPPGVYTILQKHKEHFSNLYEAADGSAAPMPFMQRLTWSGMALHAGRLPGYPASHGCIRLPTEFAKRLFEVTALGMTVVVANDRAQMPQMVHPGWLAPSVPGNEDAPPHPDDYWAPERAPEGPLTILISTSEGSIRVLRNGTEIGRSRFHLEGSAPTGVQVLQLQAGVVPGESLYVPGKPRLNWRQVTMDAQGGMDAQASARNELYGRLHVSPEFARQVYDALQPGTTVVVTGGPVETTPSDVPLLDTAPGVSGGAAHQ